MKIRTGFVSNSSSSSFVIRISDLTTEQLEKLSQDYMLLARTGYVQSCQEFDSLVEVRQHLKDLGIGENHIQWTSIDLDIFSRR